MPRQRGCDARTHPAVLALVAMLLCGGLLALYLTGVIGGGKKARAPVPPDASPLAAIFPTGDRVIDYSHPEVRHFGFGDATNEIKRFQIFLANKLSRLAAVEVKIRARSLPQASPLTVELYAVNNGLPTGSALASNSIALKPLTVQSVVVHCPLEYDQLKENEYYAIVLGQATPNVRCFMWQAAKLEMNVPGFEESPLAAADLNFGKWNGSYWKAEPGCGIGWLRVFLD